ncbi:MAG: hypothetical protein J3R72DRAFT_471165 [Linnemannia gamsii]|nr:MAG: hypothetical protein J3R72DRAFT_471165 [Linnemannia gamsii]
MSLRSLLRQNTTLASSARAFIARPTSTSTLSSTSILTRRVILPAMPVNMSTSGPVAVERPKSTFEDVTWKSFLTYEPELNALAGSKYRHLASDEAVERTKNSLEARGFKVHVVANKDEAFQKVVSLIPAGSSINTAHSTTLEETGITNYLMSSSHPWNNIRGTIIAEKDPIKQGDLRRKLGTTVDYFLTSMTAITESGEIAHGDQTGTKVGGVSFGAGNVIVVAGTNKIVKDEAEAWKRTTEFCLPFVSAYSRRAFKIKEAFMTNYEILRATQNGRIQVVLVKEVLGF